MVFKVSSNLFSDHIVSLKFSGFLKHFVTAFKISKEAKQKFKEKFSTLYSWLYCLDETEKNASQFYL